MLIPVLVTANLFPVCGFLTRSKPVIPLVNANCCNVKVFENIINKLNSTVVNSKENFWDNWTLEEEKHLLELYLIFSKKESQIFDLIYRNHWCDSWEDIFRDYDTNYLKDKTTGVEIAINEIVEQIESTK